MRSLSFRLFLSYSFTVFASGCLSPMVQDGWLRQSYFSYQAGEKEGNVPFSFKSRTWKLRTFFLLRPHWPVLSYLTTPSCVGTGKCGLSLSWVIVLPSLRFFYGKQRKRWWGHLFLLKTLSTQTIYAWLL